MSSSEINTEAESLKVIRGKYKDEFRKGTPIVVACEKGRLDDLILFVKLYIKESNNKTLPPVKSWLEQIGTTSNGTYDMNTLMAAAMYEHENVLKKLLDYGVDPSIIDDEGDNALHMSAYYNKTSTGCTESLLKKMTLESINQKNYGGRTPLDEAYLNKNQIIQNKLIPLIIKYRGISNFPNRNGVNGDLNRDNNTDGNGETEWYIDHIDHIKENPTLKF